MCFSATASFTASAALLLCSIATLKKAQQRQYMFAAIPLLFGIQQFVEGVIWQTINSGQDPTTYAYLFLTFVFLVWPLWLPLSIRQMASNKKERSNLRFPVICGAIVALIALSYLGSHTPIVQIRNHHIHYSAPINPSLWIPGTVLYLIATITPFFIVQLPNLALMGLVLAISYGISFWFYFQNILSVWCFFAAILSLLILIIIG